VPKKLVEGVGMPLASAFDISPGETKEYCLALFLLVYALSLYLALRAPGPPGAVPR
jgi:hypothetical protein